MDEGLLPPVHRPQARDLLQVNTQLIIVKVRNHRINKHVNISKNLDSCELLKHGDYKL